MNMEYTKNTKNLKVLTPEGYKHFDGIRRQYKQCVKVVCDTQTVECTTDHKFFTYDGKFVETNNIGPNTKIITKDGISTVVSITPIGKQYVYDLINVEGTQSYYTNNLLSHNCQFITSSDAAINDDLFESLKINCYRPKVILDDEAYKIWKQPDDGGIYVAGVDVAEGINQNASCIQILDLRDLSNIEQVATYWSKTIEPYNFTTKLHEVLLHWGSPPVLIERNNCGGQVVDQLYKTLRYFNVVNYDIGNKRNNRLGVVVHTNSKYRCISNMRYYINELRAVNIRDLNTLSEIKTFTKLPNNKWAATPGNLDDRVMSLGWALLILDNDLTKKFFEVVEYDDNNRPLKLRKYDFDYGTKVGKNLYGWGDQDEDSHVDTIVFNEKNNDPYSNSELDWMMENGWTKATEFTTQRSYTPAANSWLV